MKEKWKPIPIPPWNGLYEISNKGNIRHAHRSVSVRNVNGYKCVTLSYKGQKSAVKIHRLIAAAFIRMPKPGEVINHKNSNRSDNSLSNLEWVTPTENVKHAYKFGNGRLGLKHPLGKIDHTVAFEMLKTGYSMSHIARHFGATVQAVSHMVKRAKKAGRF